MLGDKRESLPGYVRSESGELLLHDDGTVPPYGGPSATRICTTWLDGHAGVGSRTRADQVNSSAGQTRTANGTSAG